MVFTAMPVYYRYFDHMYYQENWLWDVQTQVFAIRWEAWALAAISTIRFIETRDQVVFLTFDDGPEPIFTPLALAALKRYQSQATWFILGRQAEQNMGLLNDIYQDGHDIGVHSYNHVSLTGLPLGQIIQQLERTKALIKEATGRFWPFFRPPNGAYNNKVLEAAEFTGFLWNVMWSVDPRDYRSSPQQIINHILMNLHPGAIIVLHEVTPSTTQALPILLQEIGKRGYRARSLSQYLTGDK
jgi:peptidoglycan/xylan/chitin deacetylase (PgdA/CDA1 family)